MVWYLLQKLWQAILSCAFWFPFYDVTRASFVDTFKHFGFAAMGCNDQWEILSPEECTVVLGEGRPEKPLFRVCRYLSQAKPMCNVRDISGSAKSTCFWIVYKLLLKNSQLRCLCQC